MMNTTAPIQVTPALVASGGVDRTLTEGEIRLLLSQAFRQWDLAGQRVLALIPDGTRTAPISLFFRLFYELLWGKVAALDYLIALGTHQPMSAEAVSRLVGADQDERRRLYPGVHIFNHHWDQPEALFTAGVISAEESHQLSQGLLALEVPVRLNRLLLEYDLILVCGPVFPHEEVGFSGGSKYLMPGVSGAEVINFTHWLGALLTSYAIIGVAENPVRRVVERVAALIPRPRLYCCFVARHAENAEPPPLAGLYIGEPEAAWRAAAALSSQVHVRYVNQPYRQVLSVMPRLYDDLWTGAKGMYKLEPVVADGGELIIYAPHISEVSYTHGQVLDQIGYHVRDYFLKQWERFKHYPWGVLAHSTHLRGIGAYEDGVERPRIQVSLATAIPRWRVEALNLGYRDPASIHLPDWANRESEGILLVPQAGEILYRLRGDQHA